LLEKIVEVAREPVVTCLVDVADVKLRPERVSLGDGVHDTACH
jgi:hypothetical protein